MLKIVSLALIFAIAIIFIKPLNGEIAILLTVASGAIILMMSLSLIGQALGIFNKIYQLTGIQEGYLKIIIKVAAVCYLVEFTASVLEDFGLKSMGDKLIFVGKIVIVIISAPVFLKIFEALGGIL